MTVSYACRCRNVQIAAEQEATAHRPADLALSFALDDLAKRDGSTLQCLICGDVVYKAAAAEEGSNDEVELVAGAVSPDVERTSSSATVLPLVLSSLAASSKEVYPSTPRPPPVVAAPVVSSLLQALPDPLFLPPPFTPSDPLFTSISTLAATKLAARRHELEKELAAVIGEKRAALAEAERSVQREVMIVWGAHQAHRTPSPSSSPPALAGKPSSTSASTSRAPAPTRDTGFTAGSRGSLSVERRAEAKSPSPTSLKIGVPQTTVFAKVVQSPTGSPPSGGHASLLGASLARTSHMQAAAASPVTTAPARSPLSPVSSQPGNIASPAASAGASIPAKKRERRPSNQDLDLATSMRLSHMPSPPNLIFSTTNARAGATLVREGDDVKSRSFEERAALLAAQPVVLTPPAEEVEGSEGGKGGEQDLAFRESPSVPIREVETPSKPPAEPKPKETSNGAKRDSGTPKRVTFKDDDLPPEDDDDEEEGTVVGEQEDVFDFEPHSQTSASSSPPTSPGGPADSSSLVRPTARSLERPDAGDGSSTAAAGSSSSLKQEPLYTLDGRAIHPVSASSSSPARALSAERPPQSRENDTDDENKVFVSMRRLTAADLPSHRASYKDSATNGVRKWAMYGRVANARSPASSQDSDDVAYQGGQSLPIPLAFPPSASLMTTPLERKTSLTDRQIYVPPLRPAMRSAGSSTASSSKAPSAASSPPRTYSQSSGASMGPGPLFDEDDGSETSSGFVAPHLKALEGGQSGDAVGWASMVNR